MTFTLNNYTEYDKSFLNDLECNYIVYGEEIGEQGTPHLQGFVTFKNSCRLASLKSLSLGHIGKRLFLRRQLLTIA